MENPSDPTGARADAAEEAWERQAAVLEERYETRRAGTRRRLGITTKIPGPAPAGRAHQATGAPTP